MNALTGFTTIYGALDRGLWQALDRAFPRHCDSSVAANEDLARDTYRRIHEREEKRRSIYLRELQIEAFERALGRRR